VVTIRADNRISKENFRVFYKIDDGSEINVDRKEVNDKEKYETSAEFKGWRANSTAVVTVYAEARHYFLNIPEKFSNTVRDNESYLFTTTNDPNIGTEEPLVEYNYTLALLKKSQLPNTLHYQLPYPMSVGTTPGFEVVVLVLAVVVVVFLFKRKKNDNKT
jgi:hypothetical protein